VFSVAFTKAQENPRVYFGENYTLSIVMLKTMHTGLSKTIVDLHLNPAEIFSVVFPELIRYNRFMNYVEVKTLEISYRKLGSNEIDFSTGYFQIKTSFAEKIEALVFNGFLPSVYNELLISNKISVEEQRTIRLNRLKHENWQIKYACAYVCHYLQKYPGLKSLPSKNRIEFLATAYNTTFNSDSATITKRIHCNYFPFGTKYANPFSYAEVSTYFFEHDYLLITKQM